MKSFQYLIYSRLHISSKLQHSNMKCNYLCIIYKIKLYHSKNILNKTLKCKVKNKASIAFKLINIQSHPKLEINKNR